MKREAFADAYFLLEDAYAMCVSRTELKVVLRQVDRALDIFSKRGLVHAVLDMYSTLKNGENAAARDRELYSSLRGTIVMAMSQMSTPTANANALSSKTNAQGEEMSGYTSSAQEQSATAVAGMDIAVLPSPTNAAAADIRRRSTTAGMTSAVHSNTNSHSANSGQSGIVRLGKPNQSAVCVVS